MPSGWSRSGRARRVPGGRVRRAQPRVRAAGRADCAPPEQAQLPGRPAAGMRVRVCVCVFVCALTVQRVSRVSLVVRTPAPPPPRTCAMRMYAATVASFR